jgi:PAS domain S-box-containing protein
LITYGKLRDTIEFIADPTFIVDRDKRVIAWNRAMERLTGIIKAEVIGTDNYHAALSFFEPSRPVLTDLILLPADELTRRYPSVRRFSDTIYLEAFIPALNHGHGALLWGKASLLTDTDGTIIGVIESFRDVTEWKKAEESFRQIDTQDYPGLRG